MKQEIKHIKAILKDYSRLKRDIRQFNQVSSPVLSPAAAHTQQNGVETSLINHANLTYRIKQIEDAIQAIDNERYKTILNDYVINKSHSVTDYCNMWDISKSKFNYMKNNALNEFSLKYVC